MTIQDASGAPGSGVGSTSNARVLVAAQCAVAGVACLLWPWFGWIAAFAVAIRFAVLARRAQDRNLFRLAGWTMLVLGLVSMAATAVLWTGLDQVNLG
jgi:hypothetical protein